VADLFERLAEATREVDRFTAERDAALAGPLASARMLQWLPIAGIALAGALEPDALAMLASTPLGWLLVACAVSLAWAGRTWLAALAARAARTGADLPDQVAAFALLEAAVAAGKDLPGACIAVGEALDGKAVSIVQAGRRLQAGHDWANAWTDARKHGDLAVAVEAALRVSWELGASPVPALRAASGEAFDDARAAAARTRGQLEARAALPLALCFLPAFIVAGVIPLVLAVAGSALRAG
jgi:tight adherence protein B